MFDQKWLKRYMLQNRPSGEDASPPLPGAELSKSAEPLAEKLKEATGCRTGKWQ
jgi:hypothetical protein